MWRFAGIVLVLCAAGCGGSGAGTAANSADPGPGGPCPEGTPIVQARDVIGPVPRGFEVVPGDNEVLKSLVAEMKAGFGESWRRHDAKILLRRGAVNGTAVLVINSTDRHEDTMRGFLAAERDAGTRGETIEVAGERGRLLVAADGGYAAVAPAGECAMVMLFADTERLMRTAVSVMDAR
jgi:hypothetical protein